MSMRYGMRARAALALLLALALGCTGCAKKGEDLIADSADSTAYQNPAAIPHPSPPQPSGPQVGKSDPILNAAAPMLRDWVTMWQSALPGFQADSTWKVDIQRWTPARRKLERNLEHLETESDLAFKLLSSRSPDGRYILDADSYQTAFLKGDSIDTGGEPDSQPLLVDLADSTESVLQFCGPGCGFHWGTWLSPSRFALGGWQAADDHSQWFQGSLAIYSLKDLTVRRYETRIVSGADFARYQTAWRRWLYGRYLELPGGPQARRTPATKASEPTIAVTTP